jgi:hypothetical protein
MLTFTCLFIYGLFKNSVSSPDNKPAYNVEYMISE